MADKTVNWTTMNQAKMITLEARTQKWKNEGQQEGERQEKKIKGNKSGIPVSFNYLSGVPDGERLAPKLARGADMTNVMKNPSVTQ